MIKKGFLLSFATAGVSGISIFINALFVSKTDPLVFALTRNVAVVLLLTIILTSTNRLRRLKDLTLQEWGKLFAIGAIGGGIPFALFFTGLSQIGALNSNVIQKTLFLWVAVLALPILKERLTKIQLLGYGTLFIGMFLAGGTFKVVPKAGTWLVLGATVLWAIENIIAKATLKTVPASIVSWGRMIFGLPFLLAATAFMGKVPLLTHATTYAMMPLLVSSGLLVVYVLTWYTALAHAPATLVSSVLVVAPVITAGVAFIATHKPITSTQAPSLILLAIGMMLVASSEIVWTRKETSIPQTDAS